MTIIAGFRCQDGIVICSDTQETSQGNKRSIPKLRFEDGPVYAYHDADGNFRSGKRDLAAVFCGAGENGAFVDKVIDLIWITVQIAEDLDSACENAEAKIKEIYQEYGEIYQQGSCPTADLIYGITMAGRSRLFNACGPVVNEKEYYSTGTGYYLADFLASRMYDRYLTTRQCVILAAYILFQAKEHVEGCGGDSQIAVLRDSEESGHVDYKLIEEVTDFLKWLDGAVGRLLLSSANFAEPGKEVDKQFAEVLETLHLFRDHHKEEMSKHREWWESMAILGVKLERDDLGIIKTRPKPSDAQTSEDQPSPCAEESPETESSSSGD